MSIMLDCEIEDSGCCSIYVCIAVQQKSSSVGKFCERYKRAAQRRLISSALSLSLTSTSASTCLFQYGYAVSSSCKRNESGMTELVARKKVGMMVNQKLAAGEIHYVVKGC